MCCVTYAHFKSHGKIISYEEARQAHELIVFDQSVDVNEALGDGRQRIAFVSHQWKGVRLPFPDPTGSDFDAITVGLEALIASKGLDPATLLVWLDYTSIPQRNRALQTLSIASLPAYVSLSTYFLISAPPTTNPQTGVLYDLAAWKSRGWCRLEQWARITQCGVEDMYLIDGGAPVSVSEDFEPARELHAHLRGPLLSREGQGGAGGHFDCALPPAARQGHTGRAARPRHM